MPSSFSRHGIAQAVLGSIWLIENVEFHSSFSRHGKVQVNLLCSFGLSKTLVMQPPLPRSEQDGSGYQTIEEHEERAETEAADAPHSGDKTKQDDGGMPHILGKPAYRNGHNCSNEDQCIEDGKEIITYATHHTQKITQGDEEKRAPCCLQCPLACGSEGWHTPPQAESKRKQR